MLTSLVSHVACFWGLFKCITRFKIWHHWKTNLSMLLFMMSIFWDFFINNSGTIKILKPVLKWMPKKRSKLVSEWKPCVVLNVKGGLCSVRCYLLLSMCRALLSCRIIQKAETLGEQRSWLTSFCIWEHRNAKCKIQHFYMLYTFIIQSDYFQDPAGLHSYSSR